MTMTKKVSAQVYDEFGFARDRIVLEEYEVISGSDRVERFKALMSLLGYALGAVAVIYFAFFN